MNDKPDDDIIREAVGVLDDAKSLEDAIAELESSGFDRAEISLLAGQHAIEEKLGHVYTRTEELEDNPDVPSVAYISSESIGDAEGALIGMPMYIAAVTVAGVMTAAGGPLASIIVAALAAGGAGTAIGAVLASLVGKHHADYLQEQLDHGGLLLWVRTRDDAHEKRAMDILSKHSAHDVHIHGRQKTAANIQG